MKELKIRKEYVLRPCRWWDFDESSNDFSRPGLYVDVVKPADQPDLLVWATKAAKPTTPGLQINKTKREERELMGDAFSPLIIARFEDGERVLYSKHGHRVVVLQEGEEI